tara:strand:+ start:327 stop:782 length:456 start_codon:yes stop_codon:yes gene_type:complete
MPFNADIRAGLFRLELNICSVVEELEQLREMNLHNIMGYEKGSVVWRYVGELENAYASHMNSTNAPIDFWDWFLGEGNYNNVDTYEDLIWEDTDEVWKEICEECGCLCGGKIFTNEKEFDECEDRERGYNEVGDWYCKDYDKDLGKCLKLY